MLIQVAIFYLHNILLAELLVVFMLIGYRKPVDWDQSSKFLSVFDIGLPASNFGWAI